MRNPKNSSRNSMPIALTLGLLAMTLGGPAFAGNRGAADRGSKSPIVTQQPAHTTIPVSARGVTVDKAPFSSVGVPGLNGAWQDAVLRLVWMLEEGTGF